MTDLEKKHLETFNDILDRCCEFIGVRPTIRMLIEDYEYTRDELIEMYFETIDIDPVIEELKEEGKEDK